MSTPLSLRALPVASVLLLASQSQAAEPSSDDESADDVLVVQAPRTRSSASERSLDAQDIQALPARSADQVLRAMPGLHQSAHGGEGKAYQYFLRGFDAVHGADLAVTLEGVPLNEPSNVHAHGYLDLHFLPTALLSGVLLRPGSYAPQGGDFAVAGSADFSLGLSQPGAQLTLGVGSDLSGEASLSYRPKDAPSGSFAIAELEGGQGVGMSRGYQQLRAGAGWEGTRGSVDHRIWALAYHGNFESPGVLREDMLAADQVDFYDAYAGSGGGLSQRVLAAAELSQSHQGSAWSLTGWASLRRLELTQNYTGYLSDAENGDGTLQAHEALSAGLVGDGSRTLRPGMVLLGGGSLRVDSVDQSTSTVDTGGEVLALQQSLSGVSAGAEGWISLPLHPTSWLRVEPSLRGGAFLVAPEGIRAWAPALAPRLSLQLFEERATQLQLAYGRGYRSPTLAGTTASGRAPMATSDSMELGLRSAPLPWLSWRGAGFATWVSDEIVFDHLEARYLATGSTRRVGVDAGLQVRPIERLRWELDGTWSLGRYTETGADIPYAPRLLLSSGLYATGLPLGPTTLTAGLRGWVLGRRPLPGGFSSHPAFVLDLRAQVAWKSWGVGLSVDNILGNQWRDGEFVYASNWVAGSTSSELPARHFTAGAPRVARLTLTRRF